MRGGQDLFARGPKDGVSHHCPRQGAFVLYCVDSEL